MITVRPYSDEVLKKMTLLEAQNEVANAVYDAFYLIEVLEGRQKVWGNGHHHRQALAQVAKDMVAKQWRKDDEG
jgi:hypothetical protein